MEKLCDVHQKGDTPPPKYLSYGWTAHRKTIYKLNMCKDKWWKKFDHRCRPQLRRHEFFKKMAKWKTYFIFLERYWNKGVKDHVMKHFQRLQCPQRQKYEFGHFLKNSYFRRQHRRSKFFQNMSLQCSSDDLSSDIQFS